MFFDKENKKQKKCDGCSNTTDKKHRFCPKCGDPFSGTKEEKENFGLLGRDDSINIDEQNTIQNFGITDKLINSVFNNLMRNLDKQLKGQMGGMNQNPGNTEIKNFPNGIRIKISGPNMNNQKRKPQVKRHAINRPISSQQLKKMAELPREKAKTTVKRIGDKIIYELTTPGITSPEDVFVSKLESGYEIKAIGTKKVYVNSVPIGLPLRGLSISKNRLFIEFSSQEEMHR